MRATESLLWEGAGGAGTRGSKECQERMMMFGTLALSPTTCTSPFLMNWSRARCIQCRFCTALQLLWLSPQKSFAVACLIYKERKQSVGQTIDVICGNFATFCTCVLSPYFAQPIALQRGPPPKFPFPPFRTLASRIFINSSITTPSPHHTFHHKSL